MTQYVVIHIIDLDKLFTFVNLKQSSEIAAKKVLT